MSSKAPASKASPKPAVAKSPTRTPAKSPARSPAKSPTRSTASKAPAPARGSDVAAAAKAAKTATPPPQAEPAAAVAAEPSPVAPPPPPPPASPQVAAFLDGEEASTDIPCIEANIAIACNTVMEDPQSLWRDKPQWPLIVDADSRCSVFFRHRETNFVDVLNQSEMRPERLRSLLLGALRFGKPLVVDMMGTNMWDTLKDGFNGVIPDLWARLLDKTVTSTAVIQQLIRPEDDTSVYDPIFFKPGCPGFALSFVTTALYIPKSLVPHVVVLHVK